MSIEPKEGPENLCRRGQLCDVGLISVGGVESAPPYFPGGTDRQRRIRIVYKIELFRGRYFRMLSQ